MSCTATSGQEITEEMINRWCDAYEQGDFPDGEQTIGEVVIGRPPLYADNAAIVSAEAFIDMTADLKED